jgi:hypothetical protein
MVLIMTMNTALSTILSTQVPRITARLQHQRTPTTMALKTIPIINTTTANMIVLAGIITARSTMDLLAPLDALEMGMEMVYQRLIRDMDLTRMGRSSMDIMGLLNALKTNTMDLLGFLDMVMSMVDRSLMRGMDTGLTRTGRIKMDTMGTMDHLGLLYLLYRLDLLHTLTKEPSMTDRRLKTERNICHMGMGL